MRYRNEEEQDAPGFGWRAVWFLIHTLIALAAWLALMLVGYALHPPIDSQTPIVGLSIFVPLFVGYFVARLHPDKIATNLWLLGFIWLFIISLWILYIPTGPDRCYQCGAVDRLTRTLFSIPTPSGLIDDDGPFLGTWPAAALIGYSIGAWLGNRRRQRRRRSH